MDVRKQVEYWEKSAQHDFETAGSLMKSKKYDWALFLAHLVLEKILKALYVQEKRTFPPKTHNLVVLLKEIGVELSDEDYDFFEEVNTFNIATRYPDEQFKFYKLCTGEFSGEKFTKIEGKYRWLKKMLK